MNPARIIFAGTPDFALASLRALVDARILPVAVLTQPDRPAGRGRRLAASPVKKFATARQLPVLQPATLKDAGIVARLAGLRPDLIVVAAYGLILPQAVLDVPASGCLNVHASLLPRWRGAAPIQAAILAGDAATGISLMRMEAGLDSGPVYATAGIPIGAEDTAGDLHDRLAVLGGQLLVDKLPDILAGSIEPEDQDESLVTYAGKIRKEDARLDWTRDADSLHRRVRAYNPVPGAWFEFAGERIKCWRATPGSAEGGAPGQVTAAGSCVEVACGSGSLLLTELQRPGRKPVTAAEFATQFPLVGRRFH
ncbi:MAG: methionyl-tRNA formyltransferase [Gammaproteobacteria bacterium]|nr:methionyl-tRNA formyltransferase [Gammaproteobacteria bacterium]MDH4254172.1 methionyl-tRNA formyltransferase [Gammaproteobacteria bacterium]MDH5309966.1 methionyl-tRNA formyltransferase [Gammaproteobacteria bacterium]